MSDLKKSIDENLANLRAGGFASRSTMIDLLTGSKDRIEKLESALQKIKDLHHGPEDEDVLWIRDDMTYKIVCDVLEGKDDNGDLLE